jgi:hypothetical protein
MVYGVELSRRLHNDSAAGARLEICSGAGSPVRSPKRRGIGPADEIERSDVEAAHGPR